LDVNGAIFGIGMVPPGGIVMFFGDIDKSFDAEGTGRKNTLYEGWQLCNGGNGAPDLRGRFVLGAGQGPDLTNRLMGQSGGEETHILANQEIPIHDHQVTIPVYEPQTKSEKIYSFTNTSRKYCYGIKKGETKEKTTTTPAGGGSAHNNMPPYYTLAFIMRLP
jgi:microcystin-dependent protein